MTRLHFRNITPVAEESQSRGKSEKSSGDALLQHGRHSVSGLSQACGKIYSDVPAEMMEINELLARIIKKIIS